MNNLRCTAIPFDLAGYEPGLAFRQQSLEIGPVRVKKHQGQRTGIVEYVDTVGHSPVVAWRRLVLADLRLDGDDATLRQLVDSRAVPPVNDTGG